MQIGLSKQGVPYRNRTSTNRGKYKSLRDNLWNRGRHLIYRYLTGRRKRTTMALHVVYEDISSSSTTFPLQPHSFPFPCSKGIESSCPSVLKSNAGPAQTGFTNVLEVRFSTEHTYRRHPGALGNAVEQKTAFSTQFIGVSHCGQQGLVGPNRLIINWTLSIEFVGAYKDP